MGAPKGNKFAVGNNGGPPKGNKNAVGNNGGAPEKYSMEWIEQEAQHFLEWMKRPDSIFIKSFAVERGYHSNRLAEFAEKSVVFMGVYKLAKEWQESRLVNYSLFNKVNYGMTKFVLSNHHNYTEKQQVTGDAANPLSFLLQKVDGKSKDLLNENERD